MPVDRTVSQLGQHMWGKSDNGVAVVGVDPSQVNSCKIDKLGDLRCYAAVPGTKCNWAVSNRNEKGVFHGVWAVLQNR